MAKSVQQAKNKTSKGHSKQIIATEINTNFKAIFQNHKPDLEGWNITTLWLGKVQLGGLEY